MKCGIKGNMLHLDKGKDDYLLKNRTSFMDFPSKLTCCLPRSTNKVEYSNRFQSVSILNCAYLSLLMMFSPLIENSRSSESHNFSNSLT